MPEAKLVSGLGRGRGGEGMKIDVGGRAVEVGEVELRVHVRRKAEIVSDGRIGVCLLEAEKRVEMNFGGGREEEFEWTAWSRFIWIGSTPVVWSWIDVIRTWRSAGIVCMRGNIRLVVFVVVVIVFVVVVIVIVVI